MTPLGREEVSRMPGITAKCVECGADLRYDPQNLKFECPVCRPIAIEVPATEEVRESRKEAA